MVIYRDNGQENGNYNNIGLGKLRKAYLATSPPALTAKQQILLSV